MTDINNENSNSEIGELDVIDENDDIDAIKEKFTSNTDKFGKMSEANKQLYSRAKKGEGFELKDGKWAKKENPKPTDEKKPAEEKTSQGLDYGQKAYLIAEGIKRGAETELVEQVMEDSGKNLEDVLDSKYFQGELKVLRDDVKTKIATPSSSKRSTTTSRDKVDYWIAKGELPPIEQIELRRAVVNAKVKQEEPNSNFTSNPTGNITVR